MNSDQETFSSFYLYNEHKVLSCSHPLKIFIQYKKYRLNLITGKREQSGFEDFFDLLDSFKVDHYFSQPVVIHLFFELGFLCNNLVDKINDNVPLALYIEYESFNKKDIFEYQSEEAFEFDGVTIPNFEDYHHKFEKVYSHLVDGDCYQVNLTIPIILRMKDLVRPRDILQSIWRAPLNVGAYAHGTYCHALDKFYLSNSPECLFQISEDNKGHHITALPIKGTIKVEDNQREDAWEELVNSQKDQAELFMIADLIRNDLTKINLTPAVVKHKKCPLNVPGLIHQFSVIEAAIESNTTIKDVILNTFPGGSITGAPKKRVLEIIQNVENFERHFYCGSTLLLFKNSKMASINIRSAVVDYTENEITYGSGGGVTLLSQPKSEYEEILNKLQSFTKIFAG